MKTIVQVGAENYICRAVRPDPIKRGEVIKVENDAVAISLLSVTYRDVANNSHPYFVTTDDARAQRYLSKGQKEDEAPPPKQRRRRTKANSGENAADTETA